MLRTSLAPEINSMWRRSRKSLTHHEAKDYSGEEAADEALPGLLRRKLRGGRTHAQRWPFKNHSAVNILWPGRLHSATCQLLMLVNSDAVLARCPRDDLTDWLMSLPAGQRNKFYLNNGERQMQVYTETSSLGALYAAKLFVLACGTGTNCLTVGQSWKKKKKKELPFRVRAEHWFCCNFAPVHSLLTLM